MGEMMEQADFENARQRVSIERSVQLEELEKKIQAIRTEMNSRGMLHSGNTAMRIASACAEAAELRGEMVWKVLHRVALTTGVEFEDGLAKKLEEFIDGEMPPELGGLRALAIREARRQQNARIEPQLLELVDRARSRAVDRAHNEIELFVASLKAMARRPRDERVLIQNYGPVGAIQTGQRAVSHVTQVLDEESKARLDAGLLALQEALIRVEGLPQPRDEILEVVGDARAEIAKPQPNQTKLKSLLETISLPIKTVRDLRDVGEMLRPALQMFGIDI